MQWPHTAVMPASSHAVGRMNCLLSRRKQVAVMPLGLLQDPSAWLQS